jgi:hypothetical protein
MGGGTLQTLNVVKCRTLDRARFLLLFADCAAKAAHEEEFVATGCFHVVFMQRIKVAYFQRLRQFGRIDCTDVHSVRRNAINLRPP